MKDVAELFKAIRETNDINDDIVGKYFLFPDKYSKKDMQTGYNMTIIFGNGSRYLLIMHFFWGGFMDSPAVMMIPGNHY